MEIGKAPSVDIEGGALRKIMDEDREQTIRAAWEERGKAQWNPETHGRGLLSLHIPAKVEVTPVRLEAKPHDHHRTGLNRWRSSSVSIRYSQ
jgi:hypothetical protein